MSNIKHTLNQIILVVSLYAVCRIFNEICSFSNKKELKKYKGKSIMYIEQLYQADIKIYKDIQG